MSQTDPNMLLSFILLLIIASLTAYYASRKGRNPLLWFIIGILLGIFAPLILLFFPAVKNNVTDNGMPTMTVSPPDHAHQQLSQPPPTPAELKRQQEEEKLWYYLDQNHQQVGPVSVVALRELWHRGQLELNNYVWTDGMEQWEKVDNLPQLKEVLNKP
jgi:hypothetical protein